MTTMSETETDEEVEQDEEMPEMPDDLAEAVGAEGPMNVGEFITGGQVRDALQRDVFENPETGHQYSQADMLADIINVMRLDTKQLARIHGIDVEMDRMSPAKAARLMEGMATGDSNGLLQVFQDIEDKQDLIMQEELSEEAHDQYMQFKLSVMNTVSDEDAANAMGDGA